MNVREYEGHRSTASQALARLVAGNERFMRGDARFRTGWTPALAEAEKRAYHPYATVLACSDSPVSPELLFDVGVGELFVVQVVGSTIAPDVLGILPYVAQLRTALLVVLGHQGCGAVQVALSAIRERACDAAIAPVLEALTSSMYAIDKNVAAIEMLDAAVEANIRWSTHQLREAARHARMEDSIELIGAVHELKSGHVRFLR
jgi:carbonic anhydrase